MALIDSVPDTVETSSTTLISIENATGSFDQDTLIGNDGDNVLDGLEGDDLLEGGSGNDTLLGGTGDDVLESGTGTDVLDGQGGADTASFSDLPFEVDASLLTGEAIYSPAEGVTVIDTLISIENLTGTLDDYSLINLGSTNLIALDDGNGTFDFEGDDLIATVINSDFVSGELDTATDLIFV